MSFLKNLLIFVGVDIAIFILRILFLGLLETCSKKLVEKSDTSGKTSGFYSFFSLFLMHIITLINNAIPFSFLLLILYRWEKIFAVALIIVLALCLYLSFGAVYTSANDLIDDGYKHMPAFISVFLVLILLSDYLIDFSAFVIMDSFGCEDIIRAGIHIGIFSLFAILNFVYIILLAKRKNVQ